MEQVLTGAALDDLELLMDGVYAPLDGYPSTARMQVGVQDLPHLELVVDDAPEVGETVRLLDEELAPLAEVVVAGVEPVESGHRVTGPVRRTGRREHLAFQRHRQPPTEVRDQLGDATVVVVADRPLVTTDVASIGAAASGRPVLLLGLVGTGRVRDAGALLRTLRQAAEALGARLVAVPLPVHPAAPGLPARVGAAYGARDLYAALAAGPTVVADAARALGLRLVPADTGTAAWDRVQTAIRSSGPVEEEELLPGTADDVRRLLLGPDSPGVVVLLTGLSGSGKSTIARAVHDALTESQDRPVTLLDGDLVRRELSYGLGFSREDRERNVHRIGWVAAEIARHGGTVLCSPIAPYDRTRRQVRRMVEERGGRLVLVHVATPLEVCEARDRKGLYARARRGELPAFTGISDPYEAPTDADLVLDTSVVPLDASVEAVLAAMRTAAPS